MKGAEQILDPKVVMLEHSKAKVSLYVNYLAIYLNVLERVEFIHKIFIYDLMCGEGIYNDGSKGSSITALETIKDHYFAHGKNCKPTSLVLNDNGVSEIEQGKSKIKRVEEAAETIFRPPNLEVRFRNHDYTELLPLLFREIRSLRESERALLFIDPYGYKAVKPEHLKQLLAGGKTEVILFLPASFLYRFAEKSFYGEFPGSEPLHKFLEALFENNLPIFASVEDFISKVGERFKNYLGLFVGTFTIERDSQNVYALFHFTSNIAGFRKMLEVKWNMDKDRGKGFRKSEEPFLFSEIELDRYPEKLLEFIKAKVTATNKELYIFGLNSCYLPKHTNKILQQWQKEDRIEVIDPGGKLWPRKGAFYTDSDSRSVLIRLKN